MPDLTETMWFCSHDGYSPRNRGNWCDRGCGSDFNRMIGVPARHIEKLLSERLDALTERSPGTRNTKEQT